MLILTHIWGYIHVHTFQFLTTFEMDYLASQLVIGAIELETTVLPPQVMWETSLVIQWT